MRETPLVRVAPSRARRSLPAGGRLGRNGVGLLDSVRVEVHAGHTSTQPTLTPRTAQPLPPVEHGADDSLQFQFQ